MRPRRIQVRDVVRDGEHEFGADEPALRVPYDLFHPSGPVHRRGEMLDWLQGEETRSARSAPTVLGETHPGERVLVRLRPEGPDEEWWLCEVEATDDAGEPLRAPANRGAST
jgi:hypothetical protein